MANKQMRRKDTAVPIAYSILALGGCGWSAPRPGRFIRRKEPQYLLCLRLGGPQGWYGRVRKLLPTPGLEPRTVQPLV